MTLEGTCGPLNSQPRPAQNNSSWSTIERNSNYMIIDKHTLAGVSIVGCSLDVLGALYLAYDLLGGEHGPLRTLTRGVTYGALFGTGFGLALGPVVGIVSGVAH